MLCALRSRAISRLLSHAAPHLAHVHSHAHAHAKTEMSALPLSLAHLRLPRTNRSDREVHDLWKDEGSNLRTTKVSIRVQIIRMQMQLPRPIASCCRSCCIRSPHDHNHNATAALSLYSRGVEPAAHKGKWTQITHGKVWPPRLQCRVLLLSCQLSRPPAPRSLRLSTSVITKRNSVLTVD